MSDINGDQYRNSTISASSSAQTWEWSHSHQNFLLQNLTAGSNTAADTSLFFDTVSAVDTASVTAIQLQAGQVMIFNSPANVRELTFYSTGTVRYQVIPLD